MTLEEKIISMTDEIRKMAEIFTKAIVDQRKIYEDLITQEVNARIELEKRVKKLEVR